MAEKQITRVLDAVQAGCRTSLEVADTTGLSLKIASSYLSALANDGVIRRDRMMVRFPENHRPFFSYRVAC